MGLRGGLVVLGVLLLSLLAPTAPLGATGPTTYTLADSAVSMFHTWQGGDATSAVFENVPDLKIVWKWQDETWLPYVPHPKAPSRTKTDYSLANGDTLYVISDGPVEITLVDTGPDEAADCEFVDGTELVLAATAQVITEGGAGTAFYIGDDEWVTAAHVVEGGGSIRLQTDTLDLPATVIARDDDADLALLSASGEGLTALSFGDHDALRVGQTLGMAGYPVTVSGSPSVTDGLLSKVLEADGITYLQTNAAANPGNSGGPLFTDCGAVAGVVVAKAVDEAVEGIAWAVALPTVEEVLPRLREGEGGADPQEEAVLTITAFCNDGDWASSADCRAAAANGLDKDARFSLWAGGVEDWANLHYSIDGAPGTRKRDTSLAGLAPGAHTVHIRELRSGVWTPWSAPYTFTIRAPVATPTITALCNMEWDATSETWQTPETREACRTAGAAGLRTGVLWDWNVWFDGAAEDATAWEYRFNGGAAFRPFSAEDRAAFDALAPGQHTIQVREQRPAGWSPWSAPYAFTIRAPVATPTITAFCNKVFDFARVEWPRSASAEACRTQGAAGLRYGTGYDEDLWGFWEDEGSVRFRIDGGEAVRWADLSLDGLRPGQHTIQINQQRDGAWTGWSEPYLFTVESAVEIMALCDRSLSGETPSYASCAALEPLGLSRWNVHNLHLFAYGLDHFSEGVTMVVRIDGGAQVFVHSLFSSGTPIYVAPGRHYLQVSHTYPWGQTAWSVPYFFTVY